ncbi:hypothetical protein Q5H92_21910 [Hymenobacter sp. M29]|uniref:Uncharacterized protein n=1 Tax=Hymenobacter mellowenesis TaxID=3063995 RepID=A0ABT9AJ99_9BACT|nr:hypothetical protein [Hymenobacter sp. M29]MDO7849036.1 hypothetical protein [Hymenobacter sp. M29]
MRRLLLLLALLGTFAAQAQRTPRAAEMSRAAAATDWLTAHLWVREATGNNDGPFIDALCAEGHVAKRSAWCGLTQRKVQVTLKLPIPNGAAKAANWFLDRGRAVPRDSIRKGLCAGIFSPARGEIGHITRVAEVVPPLRKGRPPRGAYCIGGNEGTGRNAGIHRNLYPLSSIYALSNWLH